MKRIIKNAEPEDFVRWKATYPAARYVDLGNERSFPGAAVAKRALRASLKVEQKGLCCYCESKIVNNDFHIEHFRPKDPAQFPELQLEYSNLHASCHAEPIGGSDECCGHNKKNEFNNDLISPLEADCESHFEYDTMGGIKGIDRRGEETIRILHLDSSLLNASRKRLIEYFDDLEDDDYDEEIARHLDETGATLGEFFTTIDFLHRRNLLR